jgi:hypothetical protein
VAANQGAVIDAGELARLLAGLQPKPELREGDPEYKARQDAEGWFDDFYGVTVLQNAYEANARGESEQTRRRASQLKPGKYIGGRVTVSVEGNGSIVRISYPASGDNLMKNMQHWRSFAELVDKIWAEMPQTVTA